MSDSNATFKDTLSTMLSSARDATKGNRLADASNWAGQAVKATSDSQDIDTRAQVISTVTGVIMKAAVETRRAVMRGNGLFSKLDDNVQLIARGAEQLADMARGADRGLALAQALVIGGFAKQLVAAVAPHTTTVYKHTEADELDSFLTIVGEVIATASKLTTEPTPEGLTAEERNKLAATAVSNARHALSKIFSKTMSDWERSRVLSRHAFKLVAESHAGLKNNFDAADRALVAKDYKVSHATLLALETALGGGE